MMPIEAWMEDLPHGCFTWAFWSSGLFGAVYAAGVSVDLARELVSGTLGWLLKAKRENAVHESFPLVIGARCPPHNNWLVATATLALRSRY